MVRSIFIKLLVWVCLVLALPASGASVLVFGDSLSAAYGLSSPQQGWVSLLADHLEPKGHEVVNASISGETTRGGLSRLPALLDRYQPDYLILELGGNDGLQGLDLDGIRTRLHTMIDLAHQANTEVILLGIRIPPNYGPRYTEPFFALFGELADADDLTYLPFLLEGVAENPDLMQSDGIHPTADAQPLILQNVLSILPPELQ
ncbi:MAG: arylesterase [Natronospirillum sp.]